MKEVQQVCQESFNGVKEVSKKFQEWFKKVSGVFQDIFKGVSRKIEGCFKGVFSIKIVLSTTYIVLGIVSVSKVLN